jgi:hypothetical protein
MISFYRGASPLFDFIKIGTFFNCTNFSTTIFKIKNRNFLGYDFAPAGSPDLVTDVVKRTTAAVVGT